MHVVDVRIPLPRSETQRRVRLDVVSAGHRPSGDVYATHESHRGRRSGIDQPDLLVLTVPTHGVPPHVPYGVPISQQFGRGSVTGEDVVDSHAMALRMPDQNTYVNSTLGRRVHQFQEGASPPGESRLYLEKSDTNPHRSCCQLNRAGNSFKSNRTVNQWFNQVPRSHRKGCRSRWRITIKNLVHG